MDSTETSPERNALANDKLLNRCLYVRDSWRLHMEVFQELSSVPESWMNFTGETEFTPTYMLPTFVRVGSLATANHC